MSGASPDLLDELPKLAASYFKELLPDLRECEARPGTFDLAALKAESIRAPAILTAITKIRQTGTYSDHQVDYTAEMAAYVVTKDRLGKPRDAAAAAICQAILPHIPGNDWGDVFVGPANKAHMRSLVTSNQTKAAAALWVVTWDQPFVLLAAPELEPVARETYLGMDTGDHELIDGDAT